MAILKKYILDRIMDDVENFRYKLEALEPDIKDKIAVKDACNSLRALENAINVELQEILNAPR